MENIDMQLFDKILTYVLKITITIGIPFIIYNLIRCFL